MGVQGLSSYVKRQNLFRTVTLSAGTVLLVDGGSLSFMIARQLAMGLHPAHFLCGTPVTLFATQVIWWLDCVASCGYRVYVFLDGYDFTAGSESLAEGCRRTEQRMRRDTEAHYRYATSGAPPPAERMADLAFPPPFAWTSVAQLAARTSSYFHPAGPFDRGVHPPPPPAARRSGRCCCAPATPTPSSPSPPPFPPWRPAPRRRPTLAAGWWWCPTTRTSACPPPRARGRRCATSTPPSRRAWGAAGLR